MDKKEELLDFLKQQKEPLSPTQIEGMVNVSYPTILKWCDVLFAEGKIIIKDYGNIKLISIKEN